MQELVEKDKLDQLSRSFYMKNEINLEQKIRKPKRDKVFFNSQKQSPGVVLREKRDTLAQVFSYEFCEIFKKAFFTEHHWTTASIKIIEDL